MSPWGHALTTDVKKYQLFIKVGGQWLWICDIEAETHPDALLTAILVLQSQHQDKPIRLEQADEGDAGPSDSGRSGGLGGPGAPLQ